VEDAEGALWTRDAFQRVEAGACERVVVAVDPPATSGGDACGIIVAGKRDGVVIVLADASCRGMRPLEWAGRVAAAARVWGAGAIVAEANQGGEMVRQVLETAGADVRVRLRFAKHSKRDRAEPVSMLYEQGRVRHAGVFRELEDEMCVFGADGARGSPDRVEALVWAVTALMEKTVSPRVIPL
jgi:phage terminase large subunit-like protein